MSGWRELHREILAETPYLRVVRELVATPTRPNGVEWTVVRRKQAVVIAPCTPEGKFLLVRQERVPVRAEFWEFPAGQVDGAVTPEHILEAAHRELREETGSHATGEMIPLGSYYSSVGFTDEQAHLFLATGVEPHDDGHAHDDDEAIVECRALTPAELREWIATGRICDANTLATFARLVAGGHI
ncbi:MAG TPA: NUDIX hydrolase [Chthoniobacterales bacterium]